ncbi:STAS/SEC14 domain-containing protein [Galbibacter sp.]|jgi:hypothetical protein|uniref:STAS/SEC14 domain-containing protein n=1 Tax=Galbibacter sp. TaxID=2918471 RepID=UPI003A8F1EC2
MNAISSKYNLIKIYELDFGNIEVYSNLAVGIVNDGVDFNLEHISALINIAEIHFSNMDFGYISLRRNSYALDPSVYKYLKELPHLKGIAIVSNNELFKHNFKIEKYFYGNSMKLFKNVDTASEWIQSLVLPKNIK